MSNFAGFTASETFTPLPDSLFRMLAELDDLNELRVTLYLLWRIDHMEGAFRQLCRSEMIEDEQFMRGLSEPELDSGLEKAVQRGTLLRVDNPDGGFYFVNSPRGRASAEAMQNGDWRASGRISQPPREIPNIYKMYEENIGPLTSIIADALKDAEKTYEPQWVADAIDLAVKKNVRNWKYIEAILGRWKEEGRAEKQNRRDTQASRGSDVTRKADEFFKRKR